MTPPASTPATVRVMLVDDHEMVRAGLNLLLGSEETIEICGMAGTVSEAIALARALRPQLVLMDLRLPDGSGVEACREILSYSPETRILFLTSYSDEEAVASTLLAGASGYLLKEIGRVALVRAIHEVVGGARILDPKLERLARDRVESALGERLRALGPLALTPQEIRILRLVVEGRTNKEIAGALGLGEKTVRNYLSNAFQKLHVKRRAQVASVFPSYPPVRPRR